MSKAAEAAACSYSESTFGPQAPPVLDPEIQATADAATPSCRNARTACSKCPPEVARSSMRIADLGGAAICTSGGSIADCFGWLVPLRGRSAKIWTNATPKASAAAWASCFPKQSARRMPAGNAGHSVGRLRAEQLANERRNRLGRPPDENGVDFVLHRFQRRNTAFLSLRSPSVGCDPANIVPLKL